jgi:hypothetical protein
LLLRADLHTLYDLHLLGVDEFGNVSLSSEVTDQYYKELIALVRRITPPDRGEDRGGRAKLNTPISGRAAPMGEDRARVFRSTEDEQTTTPEPLSGIQGQGGHRGFGR